MKTAGKIATVFAFVCLAFVTGVSACSSSNQPLLGGDGGGDDSGPCISYGGSSCGGAGGGSGSHIGSSGALSFESGTGGGWTGVGKQTPCTGGKETTISGKVYDPAGTTPLWGVNVYIAGSPPAKFTDGVSCASCDSLYATPRAAALTGPDGTFTIKTGMNTTGTVFVPDGKGLTLVVQVGKWRKLYTVDVTACQDNPQPDKTLRLPRNHTTDGDIPQIAISTGSADSLECLLRRMGVDASEYVGGAGPGNGGHIHIFSSTNGSGGATINGGGSPDPGLTLWDSLAHMTPYDVVLLSCEGAETAHLNAAGKKVLFDYASNGGRVFASHFHYIWFMDDGPFATLPVATWTKGAQIDNTPISGKINQTLPSGMPFPEGVALNSWLGNVGALSGGELPIQYARDNAQWSASVNGKNSQLWISADKNSNFPGYAQYLSFDTAAGDKSCGRIVYSDLHVSGGPMNSSDPMTDYPSFNPGIVPDQCSTHPLTPQEKALEFMLLDLSSCLVPVGIQPGPTPVQ
jgi:hypothetical protein